MITTETKIFSTGAAVAGFVALVALFGMFYLLERKDGRYEDELHARAVRVAIEKESASQKILLAETAADREELARFMLTEDTVVDFLSSLGNLARAQGVVMETRSLAVEPIIDTTVFEYLTLTVDVTGTFASVTDMLALLESLPYQVAVRSVVVERSSEQMGDDLWHGAYRVYVTKYK